MNKTYLWPCGLVALELAYFQCIRTENLCVHLVPLLADPELVIFFGVRVELTVTTANVGRCSDMYRLRHRGGTPAFGNGQEQRPFCFNAYLISRSKLGGCGTICWTC